jgi:hypothetical protein
MKQQNFPTIDFDRNLLKKNRIAVKQTREKIEQELIFLCIFSPRNYRLNEMPWSLDRTSRRVLS